MTLPQKASTSSSGWAASVQLIVRWFASGDRIDRLMEELPSYITSTERARCQHLVFGVVRHAGRLEAELDRLMAHRPRFVTRAALYVGGFELIEAAEEGNVDGQTAKIVHHAVEQVKTLASRHEAPLTNAVLRKLAVVLATKEAPPKLAPAAELAEYFSHPEWLVQRWLLAHGAEATRSLLEWNQKPASVFARLRPGGGAAPDWLKPTQWEDFFEVPSGRWADVEALLSAGRIYLQDPSTAGAVGLLDPKPGEAVLDLCASPGGKSLMIADRLSQTSNDASLLVAWDLPHARIDRLTANLASAKGVKTVLATGDLLSEASALLRQMKLQDTYPAVLIDVPCSNTGVMRHRVDVKWRLQEADFQRHSKQQLALLTVASHLVAPGGRLVYSTCSIDHEENDGVATAFLAKFSGTFALENRAVSTPWVDGRDGAAAFLFRRKT